MKKVLFAVLISLFVSSWGFCADHTVVGECIQTHSNDLGKHIRCEYDLDTSVAIGDGNIVTIINTPSISGLINSWAYNSLSTDIDVWVSGTDGAAKLSVDTSVAGNVDIGGSPEILPRDYENKEASPAKRLFVTQDVLSGVATGTGSKLTIFFID